MADHDDIQNLVERFRSGVESETKKARRRTWLLGALIVFCCGYMSWLHHSVSKLDAQAVTAIARAHVESQLPELSERLTEVAIDAAPDVIDRGEAVIRRAPSALRDTVEERLLRETDAVMEQLAEQLDQDLGDSIDGYLRAVASAGNGTPGSPTPDELMTELRRVYREKAGILLDHLYVAYATEIGAVDEQLERLRTSDQLSPRERAQREVIEASVALRKHFITPYPVDETVMVGNSD